MTKVAECQMDSDASAVERNSRSLYRMVGDAVEGIGGIEVAAGIVGLSRGDLRRCLDRDGRHLAVQHVMAIGARVRLYNPSLATKIADAFVAPLDLCVFPRVKLTDKERADLLETVVRGLGPIGEQLIEQAYGGRK